MLEEEKNIGQDVPEMRMDTPLPIVYESFPEPVPEKVERRRPAWVVVMITVWIICTYLAFYYFLVTHRYESFSIGGG